MRERCGRSCHWEVDVLSLWAELELGLSRVKVALIWVTLVVVGSRERNQKVCCVLVERLLRGFMASRQRYVAKCTSAGKRKKKEEERVRLCWMGCHEEKGVVSGGGRTWQRK